MGYRDHRCWSRFHLVGIVEPELDPDFWPWTEENPEAYARWCEDADRWVDRVLADREDGRGEAGGLPDWRSYRTAEPFDPDDITFDDSTKLYGR